MTNFIIRKKLFESGVPQWKLAKRLGITAETFSRRLREELPKKEQKKMVKIIAKIVEEGR